MKKCANCGNAISEYAVNCPNCGVNLSGSESKAIVITKEQIKEKKHKKQKIEMIVNIALLFVAIIFSSLGTSLGFGISTPLPMLVCAVVVIYSVYIIIKYETVNLFSIKEKIIIFGIGGLLIAIIVGCAYMNYIEVIVEMSIWEYLPIIRKISYTVGNFLLGCCHGLLWIESYCFVKSMRK